MPRPEPARRMLAGGGDREQTSGCGSDRRHAGRGAVDEVGVQFRYAPILLVLSKVVRSADRHLVPLWRNASGDWRVRRR